MSTNISDKKILELWRDPNFSGSYRGIKTFQLLLKTDLNIDVSENRLYKVIKNDPIFIIHQRPQRKIERRSYDVNNYGELVQADIAYMFNYDNYKYFLLLIDCFSSKIFTVPLKTRDSDTVAKAFREIFEEFQGTIYELQTDRGKEFLGPSKKLFKEKEIYATIKLGKNKANFAEHGILLVKRRLYKLLRGTLNNNWVLELPKIVQDLNNTPLRKLGGLTPNSIHSEIDSVNVSNARKSLNVSVYTEPNFHIQRQNQTNYEKELNFLQVNDYVYLDFDEKLFDKSFDVSVKLRFNYALNYVLVEKEVNFSSELRYILSFKNFYFYAQTKILF